MIERVCIVAALALSLAANVPTATAQSRAGEAVRVQPASLQEAAGRGARLGTGDTIFRTARVLTRETGSIEMALDDGSSLALGPSSDVVIDDFVFDPGSGSGRAALSLGVGALRMVSGRLPPGQVGIRTGVANIGIRGTDFTLSTRIYRLLLVWVDDGTVVVTPNESGLEFVLSAPAYAECTLNFCREVTPRDRPELFPEPRGGNGSGTFGEDDRSGGDGNQGGNGRN